MKDDLVLLTGGAGYVGAVLAPLLLRSGFRVRVLDLYLYGDDVLGRGGAPGLEQVKGDIRDLSVVREAMRGVKSVIHLACISNDPSFELDPGLGRSINFDAFEPLVHEAMNAGVRRFIYASSSSVYGVSDQPNVDEDHPLHPLTDYSKFKADCEPILLDRSSPDFNTLVIRPATVCGYSPRQRLDLTVNILTAHAINNGRITVFGGAQKRPNIHIGDICRFYLELLRAPEESINGRIYNAGYQNHTVSQIAEIVRSVLLGRGVLKEVEIVTTPSNDDRSYHISSERIARDLGLRANHTIEDAVSDLAEAFERGLLPDAMTDERYYNVRLMRRVELR
ncbi:MAG: SDR family oxidoreductase [Myxococcales bacterium]|nr:SDR family oxidoreductase [Myxococcales bacterium]